MDIFDASVKLDASIAELWPEGKVYGTPILLVIASGVSQLFSQRTDSMF